MHPKLSFSEKISDILLVIGLFLSGGAFRLLYAYGDLYGDVAGAENATSQIIYLSVYASSILYFIIRSKNNPIKSISRNYIIALLILPPFLSIYSSPDPSGTIRRVVALIIFTVYCILYVAHYMERDGGCDAIVSKLIKIGVLLNLATILLVPSIGIHQANEIAQTVHAGSWRGIFYHRSTFGHVSGMMAGLGIYLMMKYGFSISMSLSTIINFVFVVMSGSGGAVASLMIFILFFVYFYINCARSQQIRQFSIIFLILFCISFYIALPEIFNIYASLTGEDVTLSGRTQIWMLAFSLMTGRETTGLGYGVGYTLLAEGPTRAMFYRFQAIQNGFIEYYVSCGLAGLAVMALFIANWMFASFKFFIKNGTVLSVFCIAFMLQFFSMNISEENFVKPHNIFFLLMTLSIMSVKVGSPYVEHKSKSAQPA